MSETLEKSMWIELIKDLRSLWNCFQNMKTKTDRQNDNHIEICTKFPIFYSKTKFVILFLVTNFNKWIESFSNIKILNLLVLHYMSKLMHYFNWYNNCMTFDILLIWWDIHLSHLTHVDEKLEMNLSLLLYSEIKTVFWRNGQFLFGMFDSLLLVPYLSHTSVVLQIIQLLCLADVNKAIK